MERVLIADQPANGGFPLPLESEPVRVVAARHDACGKSTRVRLPSAVPARAVRRLRCAGCRQAYETEEVEELGLLGPGDLPPRAEHVASPAALPSQPSRRRLRLPGFDPEGRSWKIASIGIGAAAVVAILVLVQGSGEERSPSVDQNAAAGAIAPVEPDIGAAAAEGPASGTAKLVRGSSFSIALPAGWERVPPQGGATFAAVAADGDADATLWIERDPKLSFSTFEARSLDQLRALAGNAHVVDRLTAPTPEATVVRLAADAPAGEPAVEATLRMAGPFRYYLVTTTQPDASEAAVFGTEVLRGSFTPQADTGGKG